MVAVVTGGEWGDEEGPVCRLRRNEAGIVTWADEAVADVLGWRPEQVIGSPSTTFIHPEDQASAVSAWFEMLAKPDATASWRGRYRTAGGEWQWVRSVNTNRLDDPLLPCVETTMVRVTVEQVSVAEELRARRQLLSRLADAVPVGIFQIDRNLQLSFMNDRFLDMFGPDPAASWEAQFRRVVGEDRPLLDTALGAALSNEAVDGLELRFHPPVTARSQPGSAGAGAPADRRSSVRVCVVSLRPLTEESGEVSGAIGSVSDVTESVLLRRQLELRASVDTATDCLNRDATMRLLSQVLDADLQTGSGTGVIYIDIDRFKSVNDQYGHSAGDAVLAEVSRRTRCVIRGNDRLGRLGGDEFLVVCPEVASSRAALDIAERIADILQPPMLLAEKRVRVQVSIGVAWSAAPTTAGAIVSFADRAMYRSKREGRGLPVLYSGEPTSPPTLP